MRNAGRSKWLEFGAIYARGYLDRLLACIRADYPAVNTLLGDALFERFAMDYLRAHRPRSYSLFMLGAGFAAHLGATRPPYDALPEERRALLDLPIDLARVERARLEALRAPGLEHEATRRETPYDLLLDAERVVARSPCLRWIEVIFLDMRTTMSKPAADKPRVWEGHGASRRDAPIQLWRRPCTMPGYVSS